MAGPSLATGYIQILPSMDGTGKAITSGMTPEAKSAGGAVGGILGKYISKAMIVAGVGMALKKSLTEGAQLEQALGGVETLYGKHADTVIKNADNAWKTAGVSANTYMEMSTSFAASLLQSLGGDTKKAANISDMAIKDMSDNANKFGTDISSIQMAYQGFSKQNYTMLDNLKLGYGGTKTEMERLLADAEKLTGQKYDINNLSDVYNAIHVIQGELGVTGTTAKEAATTLSGSFASLSASFSNLMGDLALGRNVGPAMKSLAESAATFLAGNLFPAIMNIAAELPGALITGIATGLPLFAKAFAKMIPQFYKKISEAIKNVGNLIVQGINNLGNNPSLAKNGIKILGSILRGMWEGRQLIGKTIRNVIVAIGGALRSQMGNIFNNVKAAIGIALVGIVRTIIQKAANIKRALLSPFTSARESIKSTIDRIKSFFPLKIGKIFKGLKLPHITVNKVPITGFAEKALKIFGIKNYPSLSVSWYKTGGIFDSPTIAGIGEAGPEAVVPLTKLWSKIDNLTASVRDMSIGGGTSGTVEIYLDGEVIARKTVDFINGQVQRYGTSPINV